MKKRDKLLNEIFELIKIECIAEKYSSVIINIELFINEEATGIDRKYIYADGLEKIDRKFKSTFLLNLSEKVIEINKEDYCLDLRWNKIEFVIHQKSIDFNYKSWWDEQFYQDVYGEPSGLSL